MRPVSADYYVRPMRVEDVPEVERLTAESFYHLDVQASRAQWPPPVLRPAARAADWRARMLHFLGSDAGGCWVAETPDGLVGAAAGLRRDSTWILSTYAVRSELQGRGVGRQLLDAAQTHGRGCLRAMVAASDDSRAVRRYRLAGFSLHPSMFLWGTVARSVLPAVDHVREGGSGDVDLLNSVDRLVRDAAHGVDHPFLMARHRLVVCDRSTGSGYVYVEPSGGPHLLAATNRRTATRLLWEAMAASAPDEPVLVGHLTAPNEWAVDVGLAARLSLHTRGYLGLRHMRPPMPYLHSGYVL